jgi:hypothetical protein
MSRQPASFRESDVTRAIKAARKGGLEIAKVQIGADGSITVVVGEPTAPETNTSTNEWDTIDDEHP